MKPLKGRSLGTRRFQRAVSAKDGLIETKPSSYIACVVHLSLASIHIRPQARFGPPMDLPSETARWKRRVPRLFPGRHSPPCAAPTPVFRFFTQPGFDRVVLNISDRVSVMPFVANVSVERVALPKLSCPFQNLIALVRGKALPRVGNLTHFETGFRREQRMRVVGHHAPGV